jgi:hypothetical protein
LTIFAQAFEIIVLLSQDLGKFDDNIFTVQDGAALELLNFPLTFLEKLRFRFCWNTPNC